MSLTTTQLQALKADILANAGTIPAGQPWTGSFGGVAVSAVPNSVDGNAAVAGYYNQPASPSWTTWRKSVALLDVANAINGADLGNLTTANHTRLQSAIMLSTAGIDASLSDRRAFFADIFSSFPTTTSQLAALWKRLATRAQKLFSTGTGTDTTPATTASNVGDGFTLAGTDVLSALNS